MSEFHPGIQAKLRWFEADHLPEGPIRWASAAVGDLAQEMAERFSEAGAPDQLILGLQDLLDAKDKFVRCAVSLMQGSPDAPAAPAQVEAAFQGGPIAGQSRMVPAELPERIPVDGAPVPFDHGAYRLEESTRDNPDAAPTYSWVNDLFVPGQG